MPFDQFSAQLLRLYRDLDRRRGTILKLGLVLRELGKLPREDGSALVVSTADLTTVNIARWRAVYGRSRAPATVACLLSYIRAISAFAHREGMLDREPNWRLLWPRGWRQKKFSSHMPWADVSALIG